MAALAGIPPLFENSWSERVGASELTPLAEPGALLRLTPAWHDWARSVRVDLPVLRAYAAAVHASSDRYLARLSDEELDQRIDLSAAGSANRAWPGC